MSKLEVIHSGFSYYHLPHPTSCDSRGVVYLLECTLCTRRNRYVGQTGRTLRERMAGHRRDYLTGKRMPIYAHLRKPKHTLANLTLSVLEVLRSPTPTTLLQAEAKWMAILDSKLPKGLNSTFS
jgi:hypothetical protein